MPHKITLTGKPVSSLCQKGSYFTFDMEENGSPGAPKGLPKSSAITYTVFINQKQLNKAGLTGENIKTQKIMVQGEPTLDVPVEDCPGEIGVVCFQISIIPEKQKEKEADQPSQESVKEPVKAEEEKPKGPEGTEDFVSIETIIVPEEFLNSYPNPEKTQQVVDYLKRTGYLDEPITINRDTKTLTDGYRRYIVAKKEKLDLVPVIYEKQLTRNE
jgi:hypothetical protein